MTRGLALTDNQILEQPLIRRVLVATIDGTLYALDRTTGRTLWRADDIGGPLFMPVCDAGSLSDDDSVDLSSGRCPLLKDQVLVDPAEEGRLYTAIEGEASFTALPHTFSDLPARSPVLLPDGRVLNASVSTDMIALDINTGKHISISTNHHNALVFARRQHDTAVRGPNPMRVLFATLDGYTLPSGLSRLPDTAHTAVRFAADGTVAAYDQVTGARLWARTLHSLPVGAFSTVNVPAYPPHATLARVPIAQPSSANRPERVAVLHDEFNRAFVLSSLHYGAIDRVYGANAPQSDERLPSVLSRADLDADFPFAVVEPTLRLGLPSADREDSVQGIVSSVLFGAVLILAVVRRLYTRKRSPLSIDQKCVIGTGSNGTVVFKGTYMNRSVAVKRLLPQFCALSQNELTLLSRADHHPHVIRMFYAESDANFTYIALELCVCTLHDVVSGTVRDSELDRGTLNTNSVKGDTLSIVAYLQQATLGLSHVHATGLVHRDIKPENILITPQNTAVIGDFGISREADVAHTLLSQTAPGTLGWRAPEVLDGNAASAASDVFSLGCVFAWALTGGEHPFGVCFSREAAILGGECDMTALSAVSPVAADLALQMLCRDAARRPTTAQVLEHMLFWSTERKLAFLHDASDVIEGCDRAGDSILLALEIDAQRVIGEVMDWSLKLDKAVYADITRRRPYDVSSVKDLLRALRNKRAHFQEISEDIRAIVGGRPSDLLAYFESRFPALLLHVQRFIMSTPFASDPRFAPSI